MDSKHMFLLVFGNCCGIKRIQHLGTFALGCIAPHHHWTACLMCILCLFLFCSSIVLRNQMCRMLQFGRGRMRFHPIVCDILELGLSSDLSQISYFDLDWRLIVMCSYYYSTYTIIAYYINHKGHLPLCKNLSSSLRTLDLTLMKSLRLGMDY